MSGMRSEWGNLGRYLEYGWKQGKKTTASKKKQRKSTKSQNKARRNNR